MKNQNGYSLVEVLIFVSILTLVTSLLLLQFSGTTSQLELELFIDQLQQDINWALHYADLNQKVIFLLFEKKSHIYLFKVGNKIILKRKFSNRFVIEDNLYNHTLTIDANGFVSNNGTVTIYENKKIIATLRIQLYSGVIREERY